MIQFKRENPFSLVETAELSGFGMWHELGVAICLMLVIEGVIPFLYPRRWRDMVTMLAQVDDKSVRIMGLVSMLIGTALLYLVN